jgi:eukaryotic-like serine/threonine-protein kinase
MQPARAPEAGLVVGAKYRLVRRIGVGGMGEVWVAKNRTTGAEVAVKMGLGAAAREDSALRFRHEARLGAMLSHRSIVRIFDLVEEDDGTLVLVMELLRGESLDRYLRRSGPLSTPQAIAITIPILSALAHAHESGIVHRDVTPSNIFLSIDPDGHVTPKLLDFGIAKIPTTTLTRTIDGRVLGTPAYMAPERIREQGDADGRGDLFSVGVILYEMLTGACPFAASSPAASLAAVLEVVVDPDPRIEPRIWLEIRRALSKQPYQRSPSAAAMARDVLAASGLTEAALVEALRDAPLSRALSGEIADALAPTRTVTGHSLAGTPTVGGSRRGRMIAWAAGVFVACTGLAGGIAIRHRSGAAARPASPATLRTVESAAFAPSSPPLPSVSATPVVSSAPSTPASATSIASTVVPRPSAHPARPPRKKPVAVTPGF